MVNVLIIGDLMLDRYIWGSANKLSPEAPVPVVLINEESFSLGGACNVASNLVALGASVSIYGVIGNDTEGALLQDFLNNKGVKSHCYKSNRPTTTKTRIMAAKHQMLRIDKESSDSLESSIYEYMFDSIQGKISEFNCVILSDYLKGVLSYAFCQKLIKLANSFNIPILCDPKGNDYSKYKGATLLTPNKKEAIQATGINIYNDRTLLESLHKLREICDVKYPLITLSEEGIGYLDNDTLHKKPTKAKEVYDVSGAGDTVIAALAFKLSMGENLESATTFANAAAAVVIGKLGSATASLDEINDVLAQKRILRSIESKIIKNYDSIKDSMKNKKIVFTNGCFDILHYGHVNYLQKARKLGDVLIVGLNSDSSVKMLKGDSRPINNEQDRAYILASLACVSYVIIFNDETPENLIKQIRPDILVKGADYANKEIAGSAYAKEIKLIDYIESKSTTNIINKIKG
ncbi:D-glycero-beta-D-manno-heptose-7-phosphate kinase [Helicobacter saguini]|uniref:Bifunctional protein HldE n=1 Tax=Helicobacter saguini TaxID=1548018 RepID=A0A6L7DJQ4_9HELI|nr:D-glycero-beta-D-manno-heptose-7-phosphate kinase [Helicobacter saguini]MWV70638.1 D-glycero-beta-D-manno-heptose-7-phosphate kinase [Helicobacter saguini]MWV72542.1 D-glycero-beta-D-manno-heptose-7-phosphate kinase [Helicobacter saguini]